MIWTSPQKKLNKKIEVKNTIQTINVETFPINVRISQIIRFCLVVREIWEQNVITRILILPEVPSVRSKHLSDLQ